ncbi:MAG: uroporphyrinogen decarboxylase [Lutibacter sp.]
MLLGITITEWVGYVASLALIISFMMKNINTLRIINSLGAVLFVVYGIMLQTSYPIIITNAFILMVNLYYLTYKSKFAFAKASL